jgi:hypothetical protein
VTAIGTAQLNTYVDGELHDSAQLGVEPSASRPLPPPGAKPATGAR